MVIDTSALIAIVLEEQPESALRLAIDRAHNRQLSAVSLLEAGIVLRARVGASALPYLRRLIEEIDCEVVPFDEAQAKAAIAAFGRFGKGTGHRAQLNFGDCAVYALAALRGEPVLGTGDDFRATDLAIVPPASQ